MLQRRLIVALAVIVFPALAWAADYGRPVTVITTSAWSGSYLGIAGGFGWAARDFRWLADVFGGYNVAYGPNMILGVEADASRIDTDPSAIHTPWAAAVRGRVGWGTYNALLYFSGGLAIGRIEQTSAGTTQGATNVGWTLGVGVEANMRPNTRGRIEYRYTNLGPVSFASNPSVGHSSDVLVGVSLRFR
jgi:outer membrane immunogenic protein